MLSLRLEEDDERLIREYARFYGMTVSEFLRKAAIERIEDEYDLNALKDYERRKNSGELELYDHDEVWSKL
ncbi:MAG: CopG family transcriptional regulator [Firmicutes bacterium]|nr:CopG family transcriptional regulator [Bacillota bacterium]